MDKVFQKESNKYLDLLKRYLNGELAVNHVVRQAKRLDLINKINEESFLLNLKQKSFDFISKEYRYLISLDNKLKKSQEKEILDINLDSFFSQSRRFSEIRQPPPGYEASKIFRPPYPTKEMITKKDTTPEN